MQPKQTNIRISGVDIPVKKQVQYSLQYIFGIGPKLANDILKNAGVEPTKRAFDLTDAEVQKIRVLIEKDPEKYEGGLRQQIFQHIKRLKDIRCYRGIRHKVGLPVRGQRTRHNARTRKGKVKIAVGGLKKKETK
ncbi:MAG: 30S ribosomal protein S13 [bacterium]